MTVEPFFAVSRGGEERALFRFLQTRHFRWLLKKGIKKQGREGDLVGLMITDEEWFPRLLFKKNKAEAAEHESIFLLFYLTAPYNFLQIISHKL